MTRRPFLTSVGCGLPVSGVWGHRYFHTRRRYAQRTLRVGPLRFVVTSYRRSEHPPVAPRTWSAGELLPASAMNAELDCRYGRCR